MKLRLLERIKGGKSLLKGTKKGTKRLSPEVPQQELNKNRRAVEKPKAFKATRTGVGGSVNFDRKDRYPESP